MMKKINEYIKQIGIEIKNIFGTKLMIVSLCLLLIGAIALPLLGRLEFGNNSNHYGGYAEELEVNGVSISNNSPHYWEIREALYAKEDAESNATNEKADLQIEYLDIIIDSFVDAYVKSIDHEDYRMSLVYKKIELLTSLFILDHIDFNIQEMQSVLTDRFMYRENSGDFNTTYYDLNDIERMKKYQDAEDELKTINNIIDNNNHEAYLKYTIANFNNNIVESQHQIEELEKDIIEKPENEEMYSETIINLKSSIETINEISLPISEYRLEHDIAPGSDKWQDKALQNKENASVSLKYTEVVSQEKFSNDNGLKEEHKTYDAYKKAIEKRINEYTEQLLIANNSLETQKPDMLYVKDSTRNKVTNFLYYSLLFAVIAAIISGKSMASEFQSGTIRLLLVRPKTRTKIALSKLLAIIFVFLVVYGLSVVLNLLTNGFIYGFADLSYPNYTISSSINGISFFSFIVPKISACTVTILFASSVAYFLSVVTRNTALSVAIPLICFVGSQIFMDIVGYSQKFKWVIYTPAPYINLPSILAGHIYSQSGIEPNVVYGVSLLVALSVIITAIGTFLFNKKDIVN